MAVWSSASAIIALGAVSKVNDRVENAYASFEDC